MGKAKGCYTPGQLAAIRKMAGFAPEQLVAFQKIGPTPEERAAIQKMGPSSEQLTALQKLAANYTREWLAATLKVAPKHSPDERVELDRARKSIDRAIAIRDGLITPPWAEKLLKPATERKAKSKSKPKFEKKPGPQVRRAISILIELYPPTGIPPAGTLLKTARTDVNKVIAERNKVLPEERKEPLMKPDSFSRAILFLKERNAP